MAEFHSLTKVQPASVEALKLAPNVACILTKKKTLSLVEKPVPVLQRDGVLVKIVSSGICGSDMHVFLHGGIAGRPILEPIVMGHEASGVVIAVGDMVKTHKVGDRVAIEPGLSCRRCVNCKKGRINLCTDLRHCGTSNADGILQKYFALPADMAPHLPDSIPWDVAGCIQPLAVGVQIGIRADLRPHLTVGIFGCGPIGLITAAVSHAYSAKKIIGFDNSPSRVEFARGYLSPLTGKPIFDHVFLVDSLPSTPVEAAPNGLASHLSGPVDSENPGIVHDDDHEVLPESDHKFEWAKLRMSDVLETVGLAEEEGVDRLIEASGSPDSMLNGIALTKQGGVYLQVGLGYIQTHTFPTIAVTNKEIDVRGITKYTSSCFPSAIDMLARGVVDLKPMITTRFPLSKSQEAFEAVATGEHIKVVIMNQECFPSE